jgi:hypothetical protein
VNVRLRDWTRLGLWGWVRSLRLNLWLARHGLASDDRVKATELVKQRGHPGSALWRLHDLQEVPELALEVRVLDAT